MNGNDENLKKRLLELASRADAQGVYTFTPFLDLNGLAVLATLKGALRNIPYAAFGGMETCERKLVRFGSAELCGYDAIFPIACVRIAPRSDKYADALTHRDFLGALMNLGIKRETLGDIFVDGSTGYLFCTEAVAPFIMENLIKVSHTDVTCESVPSLPASAAPKLAQETVQLSGERLDALIAKAYRLSREDSAELFRQQRVFVNAAPCESLSAVPKADDIISVRGFGRFAYRGVTGTSKKGKLNVLIEKYSG